MGLDDGEWIHDEASGSAGDEGPADEWAASNQSSVAGTRGGDRGARGASGTPGLSGRSGFSVRVAAVVAVVAALAGVAAALLIMRGTPAATAAATPSASASATAGSGAGLPALPALTGRGGQLQLMLTGKVLAVSGTSITIGGNGPSVTAAVTRATKVTGTARGIGGIKVGDEVSAQITGSGHKLAVSAIQDPSE